MKNFLLGVLFTLFVLIFGGLAYLRLGFAEVAGDIPPGRLETALMFASAHASVRRRAPEMPNPVQPTDANLLAGGKIYLGECSGCHGTPGKTDGIPNSLYPPIPQLPQTGTEYTEAQIFWVAKHGIRLSGMFANGKWDDDKKLWTVAAYIKRIKSIPPSVQAELSKPAAPAAAEAKPENK
jgi:mono/diheme cytochrome c family protein